MVPKAMGNIEFSTVPRRIISQSELVDSSFVSQLALVRSR